MHERFSCISFPVCHLQQSSTLVNMFRLDESIEFSFFKDMQGKAPVLITLKIRCKCRDVPSRLEAISI